jgi:Spondin_N
MRLTKVFALSSLLLSLGLAGCNHDDDETPPITTSSYDITVTNITNNQPLTPVAFVMHKSGYNAWSLGFSATVGLEELAESGSPTAFIAEATANADVLAATSLSAPMGPGGNETVSVTVNSNSSLMLSVATMLANTNDAFSGVTSWDVSGLETGDSMTVLAKVFDAGTEINDEANIPGPAAGGEGFNTARDSLVEKVVIHPGVVTSDDGLATSELNESHRWQTYAAKISITKTN